MLQLPDSGQNFTEIRLGNFLYVDKTRYLYDIVKGGGCYFLSRPRRFGKSLLLGALEEILAGDRELFKGLWIDSSDHDFKKHTVIPLSMAVNSLNAAAMRQSLNLQIISLALRRGANLNAANLYDANILRETPPEVVLQIVINALYYPGSPPVAVLIDEYDSPIQSALENLPLALEFRAILQAFHMALKNMVHQGMVKLVFATGITKFVHNTVFYGLDNFNDLTFKREYDAVCGFTSDEFLTHFEEYLPELLESFKSKGRIPAKADRECLIKVIFDYYDGYSWGGENRVLNPFSIINMFGFQDLKPYWFNSGHPGFLWEVIKRDENAICFPENVIMYDEELKSENIETLRLKPLLFYTGYLTVDKELIGDPGYILKRPNEEVSLALDNGFLAYLLNRQDHEQIRELKPRIQKALESSDAESLAKCFGDILSWCPREKLGAAEVKSINVIFVALKAMRFTVDRDVSEAEGGSDLSVALENGKVIVFETKQENFPDNLNDLTPDEKKEWEIKTSEKLIAQATKRIKSGNHGAKYGSEYPIAEKAAMAIVGHTSVTIKFV
jgi:hypothetical protein